MRPVGYLLSAVTALFVLAAAGSLAADAGGGVNHAEGKRLFEQETFGGNGRTCGTCHSAATGTVSPADAQRRFAANPADPLFLHDGSDDGAGNGVSRMLRDATVRIELELPQNVSLADSEARSVVIARGIPTTLNTPAVDPVLMLDGRQPTLSAQAIGALKDHAQALVSPTGAQLNQLTEFEKSEEFFTSPQMLRYARGGVVPTMPAGRTESEKRGRRFFEDTFDPADLKHGLCGACHAGPMLNETGIGLLVIAGAPIHSRFTSVGVSELNPSQAPVHDFVFTNPDNSTTHVVSPDPGRALVTGNVQDANTFKIPTLWGAARTAPYFHDNSAKTLEDLVNHYALFFEITSDLDGPGPMPPLVTLTPQDRADLVAYMKLLD